MKLTDILSLVKAGYTREEIEQMETPQPADPNQVPVQQPVPVVAQPTAPASVPAQVVKPVAPAVPAQVVKPVAPAVPAPASVPAQVVKPVAPAVPAPAQQDAQPTMAELMQSIAKLTSAVQANAIAQSVIPAGVSTPPSAEDMLAEIIRPKFHQRGE